jgi:hypothetical protein
MKHSIVPMTMSTRAAASIATIACSVKTLSHSFICHPPSWLADDIDAARQPSAVAGF